MLRALLSLNFIIISSSPKTIYMNKNKGILLNTLTAKISRNFSKIVYSGRVRMHMVQAFKNITGQTREAYVPIIHFNKNPIKLKSNRNDLLLIYSKDSTIRLTCEIHWYKQRFICVYVYIYTGLYNSTGSLKQINRQLLRCVHFSF